MTPLTLHQSDWVQARPLLLFLLGGWQHRPMVLRLLFLQKQVCHKSAQKLVSLSSWVAFSSFSFQEQEPPSHPCLQVQQHVSGVLFAFSFVGPPTSARQLHPRGFANILEDQQNVEQKTDGHLLSVMPKDMPPSELCEADANETQ